MHVTVAIVSYNVAPLLERCLRTVERALLECGGGSIVVVDNASSDGSAEMVEALFPEAHLIRNEENRGFGAACNQALALAQETILFLNPDAELLPGALPSLVRRLQTRPQAALVGPRLEYPDGREQPARRRFPGFLTLLVESTPLQWRLGRWLPLSRYYGRDLPEQAGRIDWLTGACLLGRTAALRQVGGFDSAYFMYFEELDLARRLAAYGWEVWYEPAARVIHHHSQSANQNLLAKDRHFYQSKYRYMAGYEGASLAAAARLFGAALFAGELAAHRRRGADREAERFGSLARWHLSRDR